LRAAAGVDSTECRADAGVLFDEIDATLKIVTAEKHVIEHRRNLIDKRRHGRLLSLPAEKGMRNE
jgi:hypothetical protein